MALYGLTTPHKPIEHIIFFNQQIFGTIRVRETLFYSDRGPLLFTGEPFNPEEMEEMLSAALDDKGTIVYKEFIPLMTVDEDFAS